MFYYFTLFTENDNIGLHLSLVHLQKSPTGFFYKHNQCCHSQSYSSQVPPNFLFKTMEIPAVFIRILFLISPSADFISFPVFNSMPELSNAPISNIVSFTNWCCSYCLSIFIAFCNGATNYETGIFMNKFELYWDHCGQSVFSKSIIIFLGYNMFDRYSNINFSLAINL